MRTWIVVLLLASAFTSSAQSRKQVVGVLRDSVTREVIALASVTNTSTGNTVMTGSNGRFTISVTNNQLLSFAAVGYYFDTLRYHTGDDTIIALLKPLVRNLGNVTVSARGFSQYQLDSIERRKEFLQDIANYTIPTVAQANSGAGIALNLDRFSRHEKSKRKAMAFYEANEQEFYINYRFHNTLVASLTGFKDDKLRDFMQQSRPSYQWLRQNKTEEDIKYYINDQLKKFTRKNKGTE
ncbi:MAG: carboxypeptidase-like regulatory domain-containing protein [Chitinophagaceae bacterium]|jgi:hypothetical protein|nr:carboxypeptidase-like regulatory domain-containing protein [Chitinophagaceae bacterium]